MTFGNSYYQLSVNKCVTHHHYEVRPQAKKNHSDMKQEGCYETVATVYPYYTVWYLCN